MILITIDKLTGQVLRHYYFTQKYGALSRTTYAIDSTQAEILVFGSSRASHHYVPDIFEEELHMSFYNTGRDGNFLFYSTAIFKLIINRYKPKIVLLDLLPNELYYDRTSYDRLASLLPYIKDHPEIKGIIELKSPFEKYKLISSIYPFNSLILNIINGNLELFKYSSPEQKGYVPLKNHLLDTILVERKPFVEPIDKNKLEALLEIIRLCKKYDIQLILISSPIYGIVNHDKMSDLIKQLADANNVIYFNFTNNSAFLSTPKYFQDPLHLNHMGAYYFSHVIAKEIIYYNSILKK
jgi:hypothetical protein